MPLAAHFHTGRRHARALAVAGIALALAPAAAQAATTVEAETLALVPTSAGRVFSDSTAGGARMLKIWSNGAGSRSISPAENSVKLTVRARGEQCGGAPAMDVAVDGSSVLSVSVPNTTYADYSADLSLVRGEHTLSASFANDFRSLTCDRNLIVDSVRFEAAAPAPVSLKTGFESRGGSGWTSLTEEQSFLRSLDTASGRVSLSEIGRSVRGRPIQLVTVGAPRTQQEIAAGSSVLFLCSQHGNEPAGREACLQAARDTANASDVTTVLIVPTANPDGFVAAKRENANGVDLNRDHARLITPETRAVAQVIREYKPDLLGDMHEYENAGAGSVLFADASELHRNVDSQVQQLTSTLHRSYAIPAATAAGFSTGLWSSEDVAANEAIMRQQSALGHVPSLLVETPRLGTLSPLRRVKAHHLEISAMVKLAAEKTAELAATTVTSAQRAIAEGAAGTQRYYYTSPNAFTDTPPCGYRLTDSQYQAARRTLELHGIVATLASGSWNVSTAQAAQPIIGLLLDSRAPREITAGQRLPC